MSDGQPEPAHGVGEAGGTRSAARGPRRPKALRDLAAAAVALGLLALAAAGCATPRVEIVERPGRGPRAEELFIARSFLANGREPNFDEKRIWADRLEDRVSRYLREHRGIEQSPRYSDFRFWHQVSPGALRPEVRALLEEPEEETVDPARMAALAERHWMQIHGRATEAWVYPLGWVIYFDERGVADMVRRVSRVGPPDD